VRLWLRPEERKPSPPPARTDDRRAFLVGIAGWLVAVPVLRQTMPEHAEFLIWTGISGLILGLLGIAYTAFRRTRD
jgi:hypothetical protein